MKDPAVNKVLLVGWDAADWKIAKPLMDAGKMPHLQKLCNSGVAGPIRTLDPPLSPMLWTSISTGKTADQHGILGFIEPDPGSGTVRPASITSRNCKAIWNILNQNGKTTNVIGWWPSHPAEHLQGVTVSNMFSKSENVNSLFPNSVSPAALGEILVKLKVEAADIRLEELLDFVPEAASVNQEKDKHLHNLAALLANFKTIAAVSKYVLKHHPADFTGIYLDVIDQLCHTFMKFYPPQMAGVPDEYFALYQQVIPQMYLHHDVLLGELMEIAGDEVAVVVMSDHGFYSDHLRPVRLPNDPASPALEHANFGMFCMSGPGIRKQHPVHAADLLDITPTLLQYLGIPHADDMKGTVLTEIFTDHRIQNSIPSWEERGEGPVVDSKENSWHSTAAMFQMMELGYIEKLASDQEKVMRKVLNESNYYLSRVLYSQQRYEEAEQLLESLYTDELTAYRYGINYAACLQRNHKHAAARGVVDALIKKYPREIPSALLLEALLLDGEELEGAELLLDQLAEKLHHLPALFVFQGNHAARTGNYLKAIAVYEKALQLDSHYVPALQGICYASEKSGFEHGDYLERLKVLSKVLLPDLRNTLYKVNELDLDPDQTIDFRKYQLIIRLFLEQFHKGVQKIS